MFHTHRWLMVAVLLILVLWAPQAWSGAAEYHVAIIPMNEFPAAISATGDLVGIRASATEGWGRLANGQVRTVPSPQPDVPSIWLTAITGPLVAGQLAQRPFTVLLGQTPQWVPMPPGLPYGAINSINAHGNMAGYGDVGWGPRYPLAWISGQPLVLGAAEGEGLAINASGVVVGYASHDGAHDGNHHATRWTADGATRLDPPDVELSITHNFCELVGTAHEADSR